MPATGLTRRLRFFERQWVWLAFSLLAALLTATAVAALDAGALEVYELFPSITRGYTFSGVLLGLSSLSLCGISFFYSLRKRGLQEQLPFGKSTMTAWLWAHVYFGLLALLCAGLHAGYGLLSWHVSWGKLAFVALFGIVVSGLVWRVIYAVVPPLAARDVGNYSAGASTARADSLSVEIEKLTAGGSPRFYELKAWALSTSPSDIQIRQAAASLPPHEQQRFIDVIALALIRAQALERARKQARYGFLLQGLRVVHVPLSLLFLLAVPAHLFFAYDVPARALPLGAVSGSSLGGFESADKCATCHARTVAEWQRSMHAHAMTSPVMVAQSNQVLNRVLAQATYPDPKRICVNCHGPIGAALTSGTTLPLSSNSSFSEPELLNEGISCAVCHQWNGTPETASGGLSRFQDGLRPGHKYFGAFNDPVGNSFHQSEATSTFRKPDQLCRNCHSVEYDKNG
ncbi:MAG TPA: multiheme c-type cytochrome, partial [Polyangiaceae bacterium]